MDKSAKSTFEIEGLTMLEEYSQIASSRGYPGLIYTRKFRDPRPLTQIT